MLCKKLPAENFNYLLVANLHRNGIVKHLLTLPLVAAVVIVPGLSKSPSSSYALPRAKRKWMSALLAEIGAFELLFHRDDLGLLEPEDFEVRHAPVDFAKISLGRDRGAIGSQRAGLVADAS